MNSAVLHEPKWLRDALFYQIYPQSFQDSNGDGIGDLPGILRRLDYVQSTGANAIWLNPIFESPFFDAGYDVSDYYQVAPRYGKLEDLRALLDAAHARGMKVVLDLVAGHTSNQHPWFLASAKHERNQYTDWYVWTDTVWKANSGGYQGITGFSDRDGAYITNFFWAQPALNYGFCEPELSWQQGLDAPGPKAVRAELKRIMQYWLDFGCDGFRVDMAESLIKGRGPARLRAVTELWTEIRGWLVAEYPEAALISEWGCPTEAIAAGFHVDFMLHVRSAGWNSLFRTREAGGMGRDEFGPSYFEKAGLGNVWRFLSYYLPHLKETQGSGYISVPSGNHDTPPRLGKGRDIADLKVAFAFLLTLPGIPIIYYGDEIGMTGVDGLPSKEGSFNRTCIRTPMQWSAEEANAGFSDAPPARIYLPVSQDDVAERNVETQERDPDSLLNFVRHMAALRQQHPALANRSELEILYAPDGGVPLIYRRGKGSESVYVALNPAGRCASARLPEKLHLKGELLIGDMPEYVHSDGVTVLNMRGASYALFR